MIDKIEQYIEEARRKRKGRLPNLSKAEDLGTNWWKDFGSSLVRDVTTGKVKDRIIKLNRDYGGLAGPEGGVAFGSIASKVNPKKLGKAAKLIEEAGGTGLKIDKKGIASWISKEGKKLTANLNERFGPRALGISDRQRGISQRQEDADDIAAGFKDNLITKKADKDDIVSRVSEASGVSREKMRELGKERKLQDLADDELDEFDEELPKFGSKRVGQPKMENKKPLKLSDNYIDASTGKKDTIKIPSSTGRGFVKLAPNKSHPNFLEVEDIWVNPKARNQGIGSELYEEAALEAERRGYDGIISPNKNRNEFSERRWEKLRKTGRFTEIDDGTYTLIAREKPTITGRTASDATGTSTEEIARTGSFYKIGKHGEPTYLSKAVDAGNLGPDEAIIHVVKGREPTIYQGSGPKEALGRFKRTRTGSEFYKHEAEAGPRPKKSKAREIIAAREIPKISVSRFKNTLTDKVGKRRIVFPSDFDKAAYNLALSKVPDKKILANIMKQTKFSADTILQHGEKVKNRVTQLGAKGKGNITLPQRSVQVIEPAKDPSLRRQLFGLPSEYLFSLDLPLLRQAFRPAVTHPLKTGLPALKRALGAVTEKGYRSQIEKFPDELALYDVLDTMKAVGPSKAKKIFPHGSELGKLAGAGHDVYDYFGTGNLGEKVPGFGEIPKLSRRMYDVTMRSVRGTETQRMADLLGKSVQELARKGDSELPALVRSVNEHSGHGPLGPFEQAGETLSTLFTAPRNTMASAQTWNPLNYVPESVLPEFITKHGLGGRYGTNFSSKIYQDNLKDTGKLLAGFGAIEGADRAFGDNEHFTMNPFDTNVGLDINNWRPDIFGGAKGVGTILPKLVQPRLRKVASTMDENLGTELEDTFTGINAKGQPMDFSPSDELEKFIRYRIRPGIPSMLADLTIGYNKDTGEPGSEQGTFNNAIGEDISKPYDESAPIMDTPLAPLAELPYSKWIGDLFTPSYLSNTYDAAHTAGPLEGIGAGILGILGAGSSTYDPFSQENELYRPGYKNIKIPVRPKKKEVLPGGIR